jgi:hypothetical protein
VLVEDHEQEIVMRDLTTLRRSLLALTAIGLLSVTPALAQTPSAQPSVAPAATPGATEDAKPAEKATCAEAKTEAVPATTADRGNEDGTSPGNSGSTGWSGGTGGAFIGTNSQGATKDSPTWQPPTARGIDLAGAAEQPSQADAGEPAPAVVGC